MGAAVLEIREGHTERVVQVVVVPQGSTIRTRGVVHQLCLPARSLRGQPRLSEPEAHRVGVV